MNKYSFKQTVRCVMFLGLVAALCALSAAPAAADGGTGGGLTGDVNTFYGSLSNEVPIAVPAYHGLEPNLKLVYNSNSRNGWVGAGWGLQGMSIIERAQPGGGAPRYDSSDVFYLEGTKLVPCTSQGGTHCPEIQNYARIQQDAANNKWYVWGTNGNKATYVSKYSIGSGFNNTFRWGLAETRDQRGNVVTYNYWGDPARDCYLDNIQYNGTTIKFYRELRPDSFTYADGAYMGQMRYRLKTIDVKVGANRVRAYTLGYNSSATSKQSVLTTVKQYGKDAVLDANGTVTSGTALPDMRMSYYSNVPSLSSTQGWPTAAEGKPHITMAIDVTERTTSGGAELADFNGDGIQDVAWAMYECSVYYGAGCGTHTGIWLGTASGSFTAGPAWPTSGMIAMGVGDTTESTDGGVRLADMNGDGKTDILWSLYECNDWYGAGCSTHNEIWYSTGSGFTAGPAWPTSGAFAMSVGAELRTTDGGVRLADMNGDGKTDVLWSLYECSDWYGAGCAWHNEIKLMNSAGTGFVAGPAWPSGGGFAMSVGTSYQTTDGGARLADMNGDGKADVLWGLYECNDWYGAGCASHKEIKFVNSAGTGFVAGPAWPLTNAHFAMPVGTSYYTTDGGARLADMNGDGKGDIVWSLFECNNWFGAGCSANEEIWLYTGGLGSGSFILGPAWPAAAEGKPHITMAIDATEETGDGGARLADVNGDGKADIVWALWECSDWYGAGCAGHKRIWLNKGDIFYDTSYEGPWPSSGFLTMAGGLAPSGSGTATGSPTLGFCKASGSGSVISFFKSNGSACATAAGSVTLSGVTVAGTATTGINEGFCKIVGGRQTLSFYKLDGNGNCSVLAGAVNTNKVANAGTLQGGLLYKRICKITASGGTLTAYNSTDGSNCSQSSSTIGMSADHMTYDGGVRLADMNGDGITDVAWSLYENNEWFGAGAAAHSEQKIMAGGLDLVSTLWNGIGGRTTVAYTPSSRWSNTSMPQGLILQTVSSLTTDDGRGNASTVSYFYQGGLWSAGERRFLGFRYVKGVVDAEGNYTETYYHQKVGTIAKPETTYFKSSSGVLYSYSQYYYTENSAAPYTSLLTERWDYECNLTANCRRVVMQLVYDAYGNATQTKEYGDYDVTGDELTTARGYYPNTAAGKYIVGLPAYENTYAGIGTGGALLQQTLNYYDGATAYTTAPATGNLTKTRHWNNRTGGYSDTTFEYDAYGNLTRQVDPRGQARTMTYDGTYHVYATGECNALSHCSSQAWDYTLGQVTSATDPNGAVTQHTYDVLGRPLTQVYPGGATSSYSYLNWGGPTMQRVREAQPDGTSDGLWSETYMDGLGRTYKVVREGNITEETVYSGTSERVWKRSLPYASGETAQWTVYQYDGLGRQRKVTNPDGTFAEVVYSTSSNKKPYLTQYDELRHEHVFWTDARGHVTQVREKSGANYYYTTYQYDLLGRLAQVVDQLGNVSTFTYDSLGRKLTSADTDMGAWTYAYDNGGLISQTDARGQTVTFTYDALGRTKTKVAGGQTTTWYYDETGHGSGKGRLTRVVYPGGSDSYTWDSRGQVTGVTRCVDSVCKTMSSAYDGLGRLQSLTYPDGEVVTYAYRSTGQLYSVSNYVTSMTWNARGQLLSVAYTNGATANFTYNAQRAWLTASDVKKGSTTLYTASYTYDNAARVTAMTQGTPTASTLNFGYDDLNRLTSVSGGQAQTLAYDAIGRITSNSLWGGAYTYGSAAHDHAVTAANGKTYAYDADGNMTSGNGRTLTWNAEAQLASLAQGGVTTSFAYDPEGQRTKKTSGSNTTRYFGSMVEEVNGSLVQYYYAGPILAAKKEAGGTKYWYHADRLGSIRLMTNSSGVEVKDYDYKPFGATHASSGSAANERGFTGHIADAETGLIYMGARYYDPQLGRFVSADSIVPSPQNPQSLDRYAYVYNNPVSNTDPTGHAPVAAAVMAVISAAASGTGMWLAVIGAMVSIAGYALKNPLLASIGSVLLGYLGGGVLGAAVGAATSPLSPLSPQLKQIIGWAYTAYGLFKTWQSMQAGGGEGLSCDGVTNCRTYNDRLSNDNVRARVIESYDGNGRPASALIETTGVGTGGVGQLTDTADYLSTANGHTSMNMLTILKARNSLIAKGFAPAQILYRGHSMGALELVELALQGELRGSTVIGFGVPRAAMAHLLRATNQGGVARMALYVSMADEVSFPFYVLPGTLVNAMREMDALVPNLSFNTVHTAYLWPSSHFADNFCKAAPATCFGSH